jgi:hypothetical protein
MRQPVAIHMADQEIIMGEVETLPNQSDRFIILHNPSQPDGKRLKFVEEGVNTILVSWQQILFVQLLPGAGGDMPLSFVRE